MAAPNPSPLVLSLFPGGGLLDHAFELEGFTVVRGPDVIWGGDIRRFHPPTGRFDGIIGGDPCQSHSSLANLVRAKGLEPSFPDMTPEYLRVVELVQPAWFLRENVPKAPDIKPAGYDVRSFMLDNSTLDSGDGWGNEQMRKRKFWFGVRDHECPELRAFMDFALFELPSAASTVLGGCTGGVQGEALKRRQRTVCTETGGVLDNNPAARNGKVKVPTVAGDSRAVPVKVGGSGKVKVTAVGTKAGICEKPGPGETEPRRTLEEMCRLQGLPEDWLAHQPWTVQAKRKIIGNGVAIPMGRQLARAILAALEIEGAA